MAFSAAALQLKRLLQDLPLLDERIPEAEQLIRECSEAELTSLGLGPPPRPTVPRGIIEGSRGADGKPGGPQQRLNAVQHVINSLQYNHTPGYYYNVSKARPFSRIMDTAREALRAALPIKCLEAVFLGALLTAGWSDLDRLPLAFKSSVQGQTYRHIVLAVFHAPSRKWGALGLSRRPELMDKELVHDSLADLVSDYKQSYERWWHTLVRVYVGLPLEHDTYYSGPVCWRYLTLSLSGRKTWATHRAALDKFAGQARKLAGKFRAMGGKPAREGSLGGPEAQPGAVAGGSAAGGGGGAGGPAGAASITARCAKSVSPARRKPAAAAYLPSPALPPRRPLTSRAHATMVVAAAAAGLASPGKAATGGLSSTAAAKQEVPSGPPFRGQGAMTAATEAPAAVAGSMEPYEMALAAASAAVAAATAAATATSAAVDGQKAPLDKAANGTARGSGDGGARDTARVASSAGDDSGNRGDSPQQAIIERAGRARADPSRGGAGGKGWEAPEEEEEKNLGSRPHRSSDPGSVAAQTAAASAGPHRGASTRVQARMFRQQVMQEEELGGWGEARSGRHDDEEDEEGEESDSDEADYFSNDRE